MQPSCIHKQNYRTEIKLKCYENKEFKIKTKQKLSSLFLEIKITMIFIFLFIKTPKSTQTVLGEYIEKDISETFENIETYALSKKEREIKIQLNLHDPKLYARLTTELSETEAFPPSLPGGNVSIESNTLSKICTTCFCTYINKCLICQQNQAYARLLTTHNMKESETDTVNQNHISLDSNISVENDDLPLKSQV